jgi:hypothetical protein
MLFIKISSGPNLSAIEVSNSLSSQFFTIGNDPIDLVVQDIAVILVMAAAMLAVTS